MTRFIHPDDYPQVLRLWQECFHDDESYVRFFWDNCLPMCRGLALEENGLLVSMLFLLPGALACQGTLLPAEYVYAVATLPEHRGRGCAAQLTGYAAEIAKGEGTSALCLYPATAQLCGYYAKQGYAQAFRRRDSGQGRFEWSAHMLDYMHRERNFISREIKQSDEPGGMLLPLDDNARQWLKATKGMAYLEFALE